MRSGNDKQTMHSRSNVSCSSCCNGLLRKKKSFLSKGVIINDVTVSVGRGQVFCDNSKKALFIKTVMMGAGEVKLSKIA